MAMGATLVRYERSPALAKMTRAILETSQELSLREWAMRAGVCEKTAKTAANSLLVEGTVVRRMRDLRRHEYIAAVKAAPGWAEQGYQGEPERVVNARRRAKFVAVWERDRDDELSRERLRDRRRHSYEVYDRETLERMARWAAGAR